LPDDLASSLLLEVTAISDEVALSREACEQVQHLEIVAQDPPVLTLKLTLLVRIADKKSWKPFLIGLR
jgi:hypothetical protein